MEMNKIKGDNVAQEETKIAKDEDKKNDSEQEDNLHR